MNKLIETLTTGLNGKILLVVMALFCFVYLPYLFVYLRKRRKKQAVFERAHKDAVKVYLALDMIGTLTVYSVNGKEAVPFFEATRQGFYLFEGENTIGVQYHWARISPLAVSGYENFNIPPREINVLIEQGETYSLGYNIEEDEYVFQSFRKFKGIEYGK
ncbi:MAG: hypothetical protein LBV38_06360 [Alistipes sp.]|nr:hypothetical protein [Alistipes sp.]